MKYFYQIEGSKRNNIGDVLQGIAAKKFLPQEALVADRENLALMNSQAQSFLIANGWYMHSFKNFPPPENVNPLYISVHVANSQLLADSLIRKHFAKHSPIGCRDKKTLRLFLGWGIPAYYSSCLTTTIDAHVPINGSMEGETLLVDNVDHPVPFPIIQKLEILLGRKLSIVSHNPPSFEGDFKNYSSEAEDHMRSLLEKYCKAALVITTKIHCALPCLAMGVKVIMIHPHPNEERLAPLAEFINILSYDDILNANILKIPKVKKRLLKIRRDLLKRVTAYSVEAGYNVLTNPTNLRLKILTLKSKIMAKSCRRAVILAYKLGIARNTIGRIYGSGF